MEGVLAHRQIACALAALTLTPATAWAQSATAWQPDPGKPVEIFAAKISVSDAKRVAIFSGDVRLTQGDMQLHCSRLLVHYQAGAPIDRGGIKSLECTP